MTKSNEGLRSVYEDRTVALGQVDSIQAAVAATGWLTLTRSPPPRKTSKLTAEIENNIEEISKTWEAYMATYLTPEEKKLAEKFAEDRKKFVTEGLKPTVAALRSNNIKEAKHIVATRSAPFTSRSGKGSIPDPNSNSMWPSRNMSSQERYTTSRNIAIRFRHHWRPPGHLVGFLLIRASCGQSGTVQDVAGKIAAGDLSSNIEIHQNDEVGELLHSFKSMQDTLSGLVKEIQEIVNASVQGDFSKRMDLNNKQGFGRAIGESLNQLSETTNTGLSDVMRVTNALAAGDLSQKMTKDYPGVFGQTRGRRE